MKRVVAPNGQEVSYLGLGPEAGALPAFVYFSLSGEESLTLEPYNRPAEVIADGALRVFSFSLPGHEEGQDKHKAMHFWAEEMQEGRYPLETFLDRVGEAVEWLIAEGWIDPEALGVGGLSRGAFLATHLAARETRIRTVLGFAPMTTLTLLEEFAGLGHRVERLDLLHTAEKLTHLHHFRFYIGNHDTRVGTDACYHFVRHLAEKVHEKRARHCHVELFMTHAIGHKGHGTAPHIFEEGSLWLKHHLLKEK